MSYRYQVLESVLKSVAIDYSDENIYYQLQRLTSDEMDKLKSLFNTVAYAAEDVENARGGDPFEDVA